MKPRAAVSRKPVRQRRRPHQQRSERRIQEILRATARLLERHGPDKLTTNHIAAELGVSVGTLYHYFPNKQAILYAMGVRWLEEWQHAFDAIETMAEPGMDPGSFVDAAVERLVGVYQNQRGVLHLVQSMFTIAELRRLDVRSDEVAEERLARILKRLGVPGTAAELRRRARICLKLINVLLLEAMRQDARTARRTLDDLRSLLVHELTRSAPGQARAA